MRVGVYQCDAAGWGAARRIERLDELLAERDLDLLLCPELYACGYHVDEGHEARAEQPDGPFARRAAALARRHRTAIAYGYAEPSPGGVLNAALCIGPDGEMLGRHVKTMIPPGYEAGRFMPGEGATLFDLAGLRCALLICYENEFPESVRAMAAAGAQVVLAPTALDSAWTVVAEHVIPTRAFDNHVWMLYADHGGVENGKAYAGRSCIVDPFGRVVARAGLGEELIVAEVTAEPGALARAALGYLDGAEEIRRRLAVSR